MPGPLLDHLVQAHQGGQVPPLLRRVLRHQALRHDRLGLRDGAAGVSELAERRRAEGLAGGERGEAVSTTWPAPTATRPTAGPLPETGGPVRQEPCNSPDGGTVKADEATSANRFSAEGQGGGRLPADHAHFPGTGDGGRVLQLVEYIKSLGPKPADGRRRTASPRSHGSTPKDR